MGSPRRPFRARALALLAVLVAAGALASIPRFGIRSDAHPDGRGGWFSRDPDGLYHARRVERALREGRVAQQDPWMNHPQGAKIPWPPYYDGLLARVFGPFVPDAEPERRRWIEHATASAPVVFGIAAVLVAVLAAWRIGAAVAGLTGAAVAGVSVALCRGTINYSSLGNGDHHAWIALLNAALLLVASEALRPDAIMSRAKSALWGTLLGLLCGLMIGSWVAAILYVVNLQIVLGWMLVRRSQDTLPGVATLGLTLHLVAAATLFPAVWDSPWRHELPWMVVNLSWLHPAQLALGACVFVPPLLLESGRLAAGRRAARAYPFAVAAVLAAFALISWRLSLAPARGIAEGIAWVSRADAFMSRVGESLPLVGPGSEPGVLFFALGYGVVVLPAVLLLAAWRALCRRDDPLLPWVVAVATLLPQALLQRRFADPLAVPMAVLLGWGAALLVRRGPAKLWAPAILLAALAAQWPSIQNTRQWLSAAEHDWVGTEADPVIGERRAFEWIRAYRGAAAEEAVLSHWDRGHLIEWAAAAPSVANNFGSYIGIDSYRAPALFFLEESPAAAERMLERRQVRFVYLPVQIISLTRSLCKVVGEPSWERYVARAQRSPLPVSSRWFATMAGRLLVGGVPIDLERRVVGAEAGSIDYLRLVYATPQYAGGTVGPVTGKPFPVGQVWERVPGAVVAAAGTTGAQLRVELEIEYEEADYRLPWRALAPVGADGIARIRIPYGTTAPNGDARVVAARWSFMGSGGELVIPQSAVVAGDTLRDLF